MSNNVLFVFEGAKKEKQFFDSFRELFFQNDKIIIIDCYGNNIYQLYEALKTEEFDEFVDIVTLLKARGIGCLDEFNRSDFGEIYLFFDYDPQHSTSDDEVVSKMLDTFNNETNQGLLLVNYPMVESLLDSVHCQSVESFIQHYVSKDDCAKFKTLISEICRGNQGNNLKKYSIERWVRLFTLHCQKANYTVNEIYSFPEEIIEQIELFNKIRGKDLIPVLSSFPLLFLYYYGASSLESLNKALERQSP